MITKDIKISKMLNAYPQTLEVLVEASPHFSKLNNKILRKTLASRVTVEQAAKIADVDLESLLNNLNNSVKGNTVKQKFDENFNHEEVKTEKFRPEFLNNIDEEKLKKLDVRSIINSGKDPFIDIMNFIEDLGDNNRFLLINSFEPIPLYSVLEKKGFDYYSEKDEGIYKVYFFRSQNNKEVKTESGDEDDTNDKHDFTNVVEINVRGLEPPEPMIKILEILPQVDMNTVLLVHHHREPMMLYPKLEERGFRAVSNKIEENYYKVIITKKIIS